MFSGEIFLLTRMEGRCGRPMKMVRDRHPTTPAILTWWSAYRRYPFGVRDERAYRAGPFSFAPLGLGVVLGLGTHR